MGYENTVREAAGALGVSVSRVQQLIKSGALDAKKAGGTWLIDSASLEARATAPRSAGRPKRVDAFAAEHYILMNRQHEVLEFAYDPSAGSFSGTTSIFDAARAPLGVVSAHGVSASSQALAFWWNHRAIPRTRDGLAERLGALGVESAERLPFCSLGLSLSDQYWVRLSGVDINWQDINFFENDFDADEEGGWLDSVGLSSPDNTSEGELSKRWVQRGKKRILLKGGGVLGQEPYNEAVATCLHSRLLRKGDYVSYALEKLPDGQAASACETFVSSEEEYIPARYVKQVLKRPNHRSEFQHYLECCAKLGVKDAEEALSKMIVCDDILANFDRHWRNFGLIRNVETLEYRCAPLFDSGNSLWCNAPLAQLERRDFRFNTKPFYADSKRQLRLVGDCGWLKRESLAGFAEEAQEILSRNNEIEQRASLVAEGVECRINRVFDLL